jgi:hypothetical protein
MDVTESLPITAEKVAKPLSMSPDAVRSRARREAAKAKPKVVKPKKTTRKPKLKVKPKPKAKVGAVVRSERLDMRLTKAEKAKIIAKAKKTRRTVTSLVIEAIEKIK